MTMFILFFYSKIAIIVPIGDVMKSLSNMERITITTDIVMDMIRLYQFKGKDFYYEDVMKSDMDYIIKQTVERETFFLCKILNLNVSENRVRLIIKKNANPKTLDEQLLSNIKGMFTKVQEDVKHFDLIANEILSLTKFIFKDVKDVSFLTEERTVQVNLLREKKRHSRRKDLEELMQKYNAMLDSKEYELTQLITNFYIDFINMKVFVSDNETIGLVLLYILLFRERFNLFRYVSFFELLYSKKDSFDKGVLQANFNWEDGFSQTTPLNRIIIQLMLNGYDKIEIMVREYEFDLHLNKSDNIENTIFKLGEIFTKDEIRAKHPYTSESTINRTLQRLRDENKIRPNGVGRSASWIRLINQERFSTSFKQINLFEIFDKTDE